MRHDLTGISPTLLSSRLSNLTRLGVVETTHLPPPADCDVYRLAPLGIAATGFLQAMDDWFLLIAGHDAAAALPETLIENERETPRVSVAGRKAKIIS